MISLSGFFGSALKLIPDRNKAIGDAFSLIQERDDLSLRKLAQRIGIGRETLRVASQNNWIFKSDTMTGRVESGLARINASMMRQQSFTTTVDLVWRGADALNRLPTPLNNGEVPSSVKFTTYDPEQEFVSDGRDPFNSPYTTSSPAPVGAASLLDTATRMLGLDPNKIVGVSFR